MLNLAQKSLSCNPPPPWGILKNIHPWLGDRKKWKYLQDMYISSIYTYDVIFNVIQIQGVPKKTLFYVWQAIEGTRSGLETKVGWVLQNSGNFLSDEHKNSSFLSENDWEKWVQRCLPPLRKGMLLDHTKDLLLLLPFQWKVRLGYLTNLT